MASENDSDDICWSWLTNHVQKVEDSSDSDFNFVSMDLQLVKRIWLASVGSRKLSSAIIPLSESWICARHLHTINKNQNIVYKCTCDMPYIAWNHSNKLFKYFTISVWLRYAISCTWSMQQNLARNFKITIV